MRNFKSEKYIFIFCVLLILLSCGRSSNKRIQNSAVVTVFNGMGKQDTVRYYCDSCDKFIHTVEMMNMIIEKATEETKSSLKNPLSFIPRSIKMVVEAKDSLYYYSTNKRIDSCVVVSIEYTCIGKNAYGTDNEVTSESLIVLVGNKIKDNFFDDLRQPPLGLANDGKTVSKKLSLYDIGDGGSFSILPTISKPNSLIVTSSQSCVDEGASLTFFFDDNSELRLKNWNDFNCKGTAYFTLTRDGIEKLRSRKVRNIAFHGDEQQFANVPPNESEYFQQYVSLIQ